MEETIGNESDIGSVVKEIENNNGAKVRPLFHWKDTPVCPGHERKLEQTGHYFDGGQRYKMMECPRPDCGYGVFQPYKND